MRASGLAEIAKVLQTTPNYLLGFADNNDGFADEALGLLRDVKDQSVREILLKQIRALIRKNVLPLSVHLLIIWVKERGVMIWQLNQQIFMQE